ncbi:MAG: DUF1614 domain-containing protein [Syntrophales bacterium]|nr:DUF1614 domain-containing protein [Syntrophales bacterium]
MKDNQLLMLLSIALLAVINIPIFSPFPHVKIRLNVVGCVLPLLLSCGLFWYCPSLRHLLLLPVLAAVVVGLLCASLTSKGVFMNIVPLVVITCASSIVCILWTEYSGYLSLAPQIAFISAFVGSLIGGDIARVPLAWMQKRENVAITYNIGGAGAADALFIAGLTAGILTNIGVSLWRII